MSAPYGTMGESIQSTMELEPLANELKLTRAIVCRFLIQPVAWQHPDWIKATAWAVDGKEAHRAAVSAKEPQMIWHCLDRSDPIPYLARVGDRWKTPRRLTYRGVSYWRLR